MKKQIVILICMLTIASILPTVSFSAVSSIDESDIVRPYFEFIVDSECGCNEANEYYGYNSGEHSLGHIPLPDWVERTPTEELIGPLLTDLDWRNNGGDYTTPAKDQGNCGSCWAHTAMGCLEAHINIANSNPNLDWDLSEQYMISCVGAQGICPNDCVTGGSAYWAFWYMKDGVSSSNNGALPESCFNYKAIDANGCDFYGCSHYPVLCSAKCASWQSQLIQTVTGYGYNDISGGLTTAQIKTKLANGPVGLVMDIYNDFNLGPGGSPSFDSNGVYRWDGVSAYVGGHEVLCVGYQDSLGCWICKNSWGTTWGNMQGFFKIAYGQCNIENCMSWVTFTQSASNNAPYTPSSPNPSNHATSIDVNADLSWTGGDPDSGDTVTYDLYFDTMTPPALANSGLISASFDPGTMASGTKYYWKIVSWDNHGTSTAGPIWDFTTAGTNNPPNTPNNPNPPNHATGLDVNADLSWTGGDPDIGDTLTYDVYFGTTTSPSLVSSGQTGSSYDPGTMNTGTKYYWKIDAWDNHGATTPGPLWDFTTSGGTNNPPNTPSKPSGPTTGTTGVLYTYTTSTTDPNGDNVKYGWDFNGDGIVDPLHWTGFISSGALCNLGVTFNGAGTYQISVVAEDIHGAQSAFSPTLTVVIAGSNNNPYAPSNPNPLDHTTGIDVNADLSWTGGDPDTGDIVTYDVYFGTNSPPPKDATGQSGITYDPGAMSMGTKYYWQIVSWDDHGASTSGPIWDFTTAGGTNNPPNKPSMPSGPTYGRPGNSYQYSSDATDPENNGIYYNFSWDDGTYSGWLGPYISGDTVNTFHTWTKKGSYSIKVKAKDEYGAESVWSDPLPISMPKNKQSINLIQQFLVRLIERFPLLKYLLDFQ